MWTYNYPALAPDELEHHGVLGMKWGHRKQKASGQNGNTRKKTKVKNLSDEELDARIARLQKEKQYKDLNSAVDPKKTRSGLSKVLSGALTTTVDVVVTSVGVQLGKKLVSSIMDQPAKDYTKRNNAILKEMQGKSVQELKDAVSKKEAQEAYKKAFGYKEATSTRNFTDGIEWKKINKK